MALNPTSERLPAPDRWDRVLELLASEPRRTVIVALMDTPEDRWLNLPEAADSPNLSMDSEQLGLLLQHTHLPKLADAGYIEWEREPFRVRRGPNFDEVEMVMSALLDSIHLYPRELIDGCHILEQMA